MKKAITLIFTILLSCIIGGIYGILHDFITYNISNEYYTRFKFIQFGLVYQYDNAELYSNNPYIPVAVVGWMATWWMGLIIGTGLGLVALQLPSARAMLTTTLKAISITIAIAFATGLVGLLYGWLFLTDKFDELKASGWMLPDGLEQPGRFIMVGSMHNFSYLGGLIGLIAGVIFIIMKKKKAMAF